MVENARKGPMILVGPNCNGIIRPSKKLFPQMPAVFSSEGSLAVVSQSGNVATSLARRGIKTGLGISCVVSSGNEADLHCEDYFMFLAHDPEGIGKVPEPEIIPGKGIRIPHRPDIEEIA